MQRLAGYLYQANPAGGLAEAFPIGTLRSDLPDWVRVDDGAFIDIDDVSPPAEADGDQVDDEDEDDDEDEGQDEAEAEADAAAETPVAKPARRRSPGKQ